MFYTFDLCYCVWIFCIKHTLNDVFIISKFELIISFKYLIAHYKKLISLTSSRIVSRFIKHEQTKKLIIHAISGRQISVNKFYGGEVLHSLCYIQTVCDKHFHCGHLCLNKNLSLLYIFHRFQKVKVFAIYTCIRSNCLITLYSNSKNII